MRLAVIVTLLLALSACAGNRVADAARGAQLFAQYCAVCHGAQGEGAEAPALKGEAKRKDRSQLEMWIKNPLPPMPTLYPKPLGDEEVSDVAAYVETLK